MANSSILGGVPAPKQPGGKDVDALGPSDSSDSGSDVVVDLGHAAMPEDGAEGALPIAHGSTSDVAGTGERGPADPAPPRLNADLLPDRTGHLPPGTDQVVEDPESTKVDSLASDEADDEDPAK